jgi:ABC-type uncharacterized transport system substrate-binding protein
MRNHSELRTCYFSILFLALMLVIPACAHSARLNIALVLSNNSAPYREFVTTFNHRATTSVQTLVFESPDEYLLNLGNSDIVIAIGMHASEALMSSTKVPLLSVMVPQGAYESLVKTQVKREKALAAIYLNQPWARQIDFLYAVLPRSRRIGALHTAAMVQELREIASEVTRHGGVLVAREVVADASLSASLDSLLQASDVLLALPESTIYNPANIRNILLSTYRQNVPLLGWSQAFVNAGAVAAIFSTPEQLAIQTAVLVSAYQQSGHWPTSQYPAEFNIAINPQVSRSLGIVIASDAEIFARMKKGKNRADD